MALIFKRKVSPYLSETLAYQSMVLADGGTIYDLNLVDLDIKFFKDLSITPYQMIVSYGGYQTGSLPLVTDYINKAYDLFGSKHVTASTQDNMSYMPKITSSTTFATDIQGFYYTNSANLRTGYGLTVVQALLIFTVIGTSLAYTTADYSYFHDGIAAGYRCATLKTGNTGKYINVSAGSANHITIANQYFTNSMYNTVFNGASSLLYRNNTSLSFADANNPGTNGLNGIVIGNRYSLLATRVTRGDIYVTIVFTSSLTTNQRTALNQHFGNKFGISI